jgi:hypothetical protein
MVDDNIVEFQKQKEMSEDIMSSDEREVILQTLANVMDFQEKLEKGMKFATSVIAELQSHVRDLEHDVARLKKELPKRPAILNSQGGRAT